ncbi:MAG: diaminopimelate epimerase [Weeksellaceae bacterium]|nr:diaminopimelate epimerase [Weeksellaceae bacterium]
MKLFFSKYQGAGNDFILIDDRNLNFQLTENQIENICNRHFGIGADGLILLQNDTEFDFRMVYFNSDGREGSMCGNGGRCIVRFAEHLNLIQNKARFIAIDGWHEALINKESIELKMSDLSEIKSYPSHFFLDTGSPHHIEFVENTAAIDVKARGAQIRYGNLYFDEGTNVNFVEILGRDSLKIRTYERGVEDETLACGTGVTAAAIAGFESGKINSNRVKIEALGGTLEVRFEKNKSGRYENIWLTGPAEKVFDGEINSQLFD